MPSSLPATSGLWLVSMTKVCEASNSQKFSRIRRAFWRRSPVSRLTVPSARRRTIVGLVEPCKPEAEEVGDLGWMGVEVAGGQETRCSHPAVVAEGGQDDVEQGALTVGSVAPEDR